MHRDILADHPEFASISGFMENIERVVAAAEAVSGDYERTLEKRVSENGLPEMM